jgi:hypothetical protein
MEINISRKALEKIEKYICSLTYRLDQETEEVKDFKEELKSNLISSAKELIKSGYSEEKSLSLSINRLGDTNVIQTELSRLYKTKKYIGKSMLRFSILTFVIGMILISLSFWNDFIAYNKDFIVADNILNNNIGSPSDPITDNMRNQLKSLVDKSWSVSASALYISKTNVPSEPFIDSNTYQYEFLYPNTIKTQSNIYFINRPNGLLQRYFIHHIYVVIPNSDMTLNLLINIKLFGMGYYILTLGFFLAFWITFAIWASKNVFYERKSRLWIILFIFTNVIGFALYRLCHFMFESKLNCE